MGVMRQAMKIPREWFVLRKTRNRPLFFFHCIIWYWINNILLLSVPKVLFSNPFRFPKKNPPIIPCCSTPTFEEDRVAPDPIKASTASLPISAWMVVIDIPLHNQNARFTFFSMRGNTHSKLIQIGKQRNIIVGRLRTRAFVLLRGH